MPLAFPNVFPAMIEIAFIGAGNMASAMIRGMIATGGARPEQIGCTSAADGTGENLARDTGVLWTPTAGELLQSTALKVVVLAVKPQQLAELPDSLSASLRGRLLLSILAGTPIARLAAKFPEAANVVRAMPNTPGQIGAGITAYASRELLAPGEKQLADAVLGSLGPALRVEERDLDAVTGVSGSGPAYVFEFVAALRDAGVKEGLESGVAYKLALHTVLGAAKLLEHTNEEPEVLRNRVTSPNGTTLAALNVLSDQGFRHLVGAAVRAARRRSEELAKA